MSILTRQQIMQTAQMMWWSNAISETFDEALKWYSSCSRGGNAYNSCVGLWIPHLTDILQCIFPGKWETWSHFSERTIEVIFYLPPLNPEIFRWNRQALIDSHLQKHREKRCLTKTPFFLSKNALRHSTLPRHVKESRPLVAEVACFVIG